VPSHPQFMLTTASTPTLDAETRKALRAVLENPKNLAALERTSPEEVWRLLGLTVSKRDLPKKAESLGVASRLFARLAASLQRSDAEDLLKAAQERGETIRNQLVTQKRVVRSGEFTKALGITRQALSKAVATHRIFAITAGGQSYYPVFFADPELDHRRVQRVAQSLGDLGGWEKWLFFTMPKSSLHRMTPLEAMREGKYDLVRRAAAGFAER